MSVPSEATGPSYPTWRRDSRASISSHFSERHRGSQSSGRSPSLTPAEAYNFVLCRANSLAAAVATSPPDATRNGALSSEEVEEKAMKDDEGDLHPDLRAEIEAIWSAAKGPPLPTPKCIQQFKYVTVRQIDLHPERTAEKNKRIEDKIKERDVQIETLERLRKWEKRREKRATLTGRIASLFTPRLPLPKTEELISLARYYYPLRADVIVYVCDFLENDFNKMEVPLGKIDECKF
jgi:hypothetical protein